MPSKKEVEDHERTHFPFRSWCKHCVFGRAKNNFHRVQDKIERLGVPKISWDYWFTTWKDRKEVEHEEGLPCVVWKDSETGGSMAFAVPRKGEDSYAITRGFTDYESYTGIHKDDIQRG